MKKSILWLLLLSLPVCATLLVLNQREDCAHPNLVQTVIAPTCDTEGYTLRACADCDFYYHSDYQYPTGHSFAEHTVSPTCDREGYAQKQCLACGVAFRTYAIAPLGHTPVTRVVAPTCDRQGYTETACADCDWITEGDFTPPTGHRLTATLTYPTRAGRWCESIRNHRPSSQPPIPLG